MLSGLPKSLANLLHVQQVFLWVGVWVRVRQSGLPWKASRLRSFGTAWVPLAGGIPMSGWVWLWSWLECTAQVWLRSYPMLGSYNPLLLESFPSNHKVFAILEDIVEGTYSLLTPKLLKWERVLMHGQGRFFLFLLAVPSAVRVVALHAVPKKAQRQQSLLVEARTQLVHIREGESVTSDLWFVANSVV